MSRRMVAPGVWVPEEPSRAQTYSVGFAIRPALTIGSMVPSKYHLPATSPARREQMAEQKRRSRHDFPNVERCGKPLPVVAQPCARFAGHRDSCRSRVALDNNASTRCAR